MTQVDYLEHIRRESARFAQCLAAADPSAPVPSCPEWTAADLLWHLAEVQLFWGAIVQERLDDPDPAEAAKPDRPEDYGALLALFDEAGRALMGALATTPDSTAVWTWAEDQTVGFIRRRQAHEALIHRLDAELVVGELTRLDPDLASDGIDEALTIMYGGHPSWGSLTTEDSTGVVEARDTAAAWTLRFGRFSGTSPNTGKTYDEATLVVVDASDAPPAFTVRGGAGDLDAWLWGRADVGRLEVVGDRATFAKLEAVVSIGVD